MVKADNKVDKESKHLSDSLSTAKKLIVITDLLIFQWIVSTPLIPHRYIKILISVSGGTGGNGESTQSFSIPIRLNGAGGGGAGGNFGQFHQNQ